MSRTILLLFFRKDGLSFSAFLLLKPGFIRKIVFPDVQGGEFMAGG